MKKEIAFFDFDGTITSKDSLLEFIRFSKGSLSFYTGFLLNLPYLLAYKLGVISNQSAKERILAYFYKGTPLTVFDETCRQFSTGKIPGLIREAAMAEINSLREQQVELVIVSASPANWLLGWAESIGAKLIATTLATTDGRLTGKIEGANCYGEEKVRRIKEKYDLADFETVYAYGDSSGDRPMLQLASKSYYKPFRN